ncbi:glutathione S-transferase family protein [Microvirga antarctica]|uniref:glutathione S-transferase family protein n=1 Tax=Microvirga antarctica TaxID=2819233 RepID=UPI001B31660E
MIDLYSARTTNGLRASIMLEELGLPYRVHAVDFDADNATKPAEMMAVNPAGSIPVLIDHETGVSLSQSFAIMLYLCEKTGRFLPQEPVARAQVLQWMSFVMTDVISATHPIFVLTSELKDTPEPIIRHYEARLMRFLGQADAQLGRTPFLAGDEISVADFALYPTAAFRQKLLDRVGGVPNLRRWLTEVGARQGVARGMAVPETPAH